MGGRTCRAAGWQPTGEEAWVDELVGLQVGNLQCEEAWVEELVGLQVGNLQGEEAWVDELVATHRVRRHGWKNL